MALEIKLLNEFLSDVKRIRELEIVYESMLRRGQKTDVLRQEIIRQYTELKGFEQRLNDEPEQFYLEFLLLAYESKYAPDINTNE